MCWIGGGQREEGCSGPSWLVTCCVPQVTRSDDDDDDDGSNDARAVASPSALTLQQFPLLQPPRASNIVGGLRSASGSNPFPQQLAPLANTLVEEIANFGRNECKWPWQLVSSVSLRKTKRSHTGRSLITDLSPETLVFFSRQRNCNER